MLWKSNLIYSKLFCIQLKSLIKFFSLLCFCIFFIIVRVFTIMVNKGLHETLTWGPTDHFSKFFPPATLNFDQWTSRSNLTYVVSGHAGYIGQKLSS